MKEDNTATIMHTPKGIGNLYRRHFCHDELANLKERCTDEELQQIWNEAMSIENENGNFAKPMLADSSLSVFLDYEIRSSWWASWIGWNWGRELSGKYFAWKTIRKYARYKKSKMWEQRIKNFR